MIKLLTFVRRKAGVSPEKFHADWRAENERFFAATPAARQLVARYELNHRLRDDYERARHSAEMPGPEWDGVAVHWFETLENYRALQSLPAYVQFSATELSRYRDAASISVLTNDATKIVDKAGGRERAGLKLMCILRRNKALERPKFFQHWREHHGGLFKNVPELYEPLLAYDQNHGLAIEGAEFDGLTEQWFESLPAWVESIDVPAAHTLIEPDVAYLLDTNSIQFILAGRPTVVVQQ